MVTVPKLMLVVIFVAGLVVGWLLAAVRIRGRVSFSIQPTAEGAPGIVTKSVTVRTMELRCLCGSVWKFRDAAGPPKPAYEPYPSGDTYSCPNCGRAIDLKQIRKLEGEAKV